VEGVYVVLGGDGESIQSFLTRLRTEFVDVDAKGAKCKERKSTVMCRRAAGTVKPGEEPVPEFNGFECERYSGAEELEEVLARFNLLHVGAGTQRFQPTG
jgi:solute carrier family 25 carnitine/acylcarnitine transporter 20/29